MPTEDFINIKSLTKNISHYQNIPAMMKGLARARVWVDDKKAPKSTMIWDMVNTFLFLAGNSDNSKFNDGLKKVIREDISPEFLKSKIKRMFFFPGSSDWEKKIRLIFKDGEFSERLIHHYTYNEKNYQLLKDWRDLIPSHLEVKRVTKEILETENLTNIGEVKYCATALWQTVDRYDKEAIGFCLMNKEAIAAWCTTDYIVGNDCELYIETFEGFQRKGYATIVASAMIEECLKRNYIIHWHCWKTNIGSIKTAIKIGFDLKNEEPVLSLDLIKEI
ncbi:MAG: GNAT family N-acetyltransferase [Asgard group archaeon]|nr:GNAT family N-acetyltransferase [Asgard group archaeon]